MKELKLIIILCACFMLFSACSIASGYNNGNMPSGTTSAIRGLSMDLTFEDAAQMATNVVVAEFVDERPFGESLSEYVFRVTDRIFGETADVVFVYEDIRWYSYNDHVFTVGNEYMLFLCKLVDVYALTHNDGFRFITSIVIDLDSLQTAKMRGVPISNLSSFNFNSRTATRERFINYVYGITRNNPPSLDGYIRTDDLGIVINYSPLVLVVEVVEPTMLLHQQNSRDWFDTDIFLVEVVDVLKGSYVRIGDKFDALFFSNTVMAGETHIVAASRGVFLEFTSPYSLIPMEYKDEVLEILGLTPAYHQVVFNLGGTSTNPTIPATIPPTDVPEGVELLSFLQANHSAFLPQGPVRTGYTFQGWYLNEAFTSRLASNTEMTAGNVTLFARWERVTPLSVITNVTFVHDWQASVSIAVEGENLLDGELSLRLTGDVFSMDFHVDGISTCCCDGVANELIPFNIITDQNANIQIVGENNDGNMATVYIELYLNGMPTGHVTYISDSMFRSFAAD